MASSLNNRRLLSWVENDHGLVLHHTGEHLTIRAPTNGCCLVGHVRESDHGIVAPIFIDVPNFDGLVDRVRSEKVLGSRVPLDADTFPCVRLKLEVTLHAVLPASQAFIVVEDPEFCFSIISASC